MYHGGFSTGYNIAKAKNSADFSWHENGGVASKNKAIQRTFMHCSLLVEKTLCKNTQHLIRSQDKVESGLRALNEKLFARTLYESLSFLI